MFKMRKRNKKAIIPLHVVFHLLKAFKNNVLQPELDVDEAAAGPATTFFFSYNLNFSSQLLPGDRSNRLLN